MLKYFLLIAILFAICFADSNDSRFDTSSCSCTQGESASSSFTCVPPSGKSEPHCALQGGKKKQVTDEKTTEGTTQLGRNQNRNLIVNGGFENAWLNWEFYSFFPGSFWAPQHGNLFYTETNLPAPPQGETAMMNAAATGVSLVGMYQTFTWSDYRNCAFVQFDVSFQYFLRNHVSWYDPGNLFSYDLATQVFRVDILDTEFNQLSNIFITEIGTPATTGTYKTHRSSFYVSTAANVNNADQLRIRFGVRAIHHLRVGVDDVRVHATCLNFPAQPVHHDFPHPNEHYQHQKEQLPQIAPVEQHNEEDK